MRPELGVGVMASKKTAGRSKKDFDMAVSSVAGVGNRQLAA
jgi:hypothetical protein